MHPGQTAIRTDAAIFDGVFLDVARQQHFQALGVTVDIVRMDDLRKRKCIQFRYLIPKNLRRAGICLHTLSGNLSGYVGYSDQETNVGPCLAHTISRSLALV